MDDLPNGFNDATKEVQMEILSARRSADLAEGIAAELGMEAPRTGQLNKQHKAAILLALR